MSAIGHNIFFAIGHWFCLITSSYPAGLIMVLDGVSVQKFGVKIVGALVWWYKCLLVRFFGVKKCWCRPVIMQKNVGVKMGRKNRWCKDFDVVKPWVGGEEPNQKIASWADNLMEMREMKKIHAFCLRWLVPAPMAKFMQAKGRRTGKRKRKDEKGDEEKNRKGTEKVMWRELSLGLLEVRHWAK